MILLSNCETKSSIWLIKNQYFFTTVKYLLSVVTDIISILKDCSNYQLVKFIIFKMSAKDKICLIDLIIGMPKA